MSGLVASVRAAVAPEAVDGRIDRGDRSLDIADTPVPQVAVNLDHRELDVPRDRPHCDYLFFVEDGAKEWVIPIELKSGGFKNEHTVNQLRGGAKFADGLMPANGGLRLAAVIAYRGSLHASKRSDLLRRAIRLRNEIRRPLLFQCGDSLKSLFSDENPAA